jgi:hypothetical protein
MGKGKNDFVYFIRRVDGPGGINFEVAKFDDMSGGEQPLSVYNVIWDPNANFPDGRGKCNCQAYVYKKMGLKDKHIQGVRKWIAEGEKTIGVRL